MSEIYLDNAATTRAYPEVVKIVQKMMTDHFGNASSLHLRGVNGSKVIEEAKTAVQQFAGSSKWNVIFTSGGTESDNIAVLGSVPRGKRDTVITTSLSHPAVLDSCKKIAANNGRIIIVPARKKSGTVEPDDITKHLDSRTALVSLSNVANETGAVLPANQIAKAVKQIAPRARVHIDSVQGAARLPSLNFADEVDMVSLSGHKLHGPQGIGALLFKQRAIPRPIMYGGEQQNGLRPGTFNLPGIAGFATALKIFEQAKKEGIANMQRLSNLFTDAVCNDNIHLLINKDNMAPGIIVLAVDNIKSEVLLHAIEKKGVLASAGSACHSSKKEPSASLIETGLKQNQAVIRLSLALDTTEKEIEKTAVIFKEAVNKILNGHAGDL
jgi:cysteine desulfurase